MWGKGYPDRQETLYREGVHINGGIHREEGVHLEESSIQRRGYLDRGEGADKGAT